MTSFGCAKSHSTFRFVSYPNLAFCLVFLDFNSALLHYCRDDEVCKLLLGKLCFICTCYTSRHNARSRIWKFTECIGMNVLVFLHVLHYFDIFTSCTPLTMKCTCDFKRLIFLKYKYLRTSRRVVLVLFKIIIQFVQLIS